MKTFNDLNGDLEGYNPLPGRITYTFIYISVVSKFDEGTESFLFH